MGAMAMWFWRENMNTGSLWMESEFLVSGELCAWQNGAALSSWDEVCLSRDF